MSSILLRACFALGLFAGVAIASTTEAATPENNVLLVGATLSFTGEHAVNGKHVRKGYNLAVRRLNEVGGINIDGKKYKIKMGLTQITRFWGYHGTYAQEPT